MGISYASMYMSLAITKNGSMNTLTHSTVSSFFRASLDRGGAPMASGSPLGYSGADRFSAARKEAAQKHCSTHWLSTGAAWLSDAFAEGFDASAQRSDGVAQNRADFSLNIGAGGPKVARGETNAGLPPRGTTSDFAGRRRGPPRRKAPTLLPSSPDISPAGARRTALIREAAGGKDRGVQCNEEQVMPGWPSTGPRGLAHTADNAGEERLRVVLNLALAQVRALLENIPEQDDRQATLRALTWAVRETRRSENVPEQGEAASSAEREALRTQLDRMPAFLSVWHSTIEAPHWSQPQLPQGPSDAPGADC